MAATTVKTTYSLDVETVRTLEQMAERWSVSTSEALRRAIRVAASTDTEEPRLRAFDQLQQRLGLDETKADAWVREVRAERRASGARAGARRR